MQSLAPPSPPTTHPQIPASVQHHPRNNYDESKLDTEAIMTRIIFKEMESSSSMCQRDQRLAVHTDTQGKIRYSVFELKIVSKCPVSEVIKVFVDFFFVFACPPPLCVFSPSLDKILAAMTIAAERNNKERFAPIVEGLENHDAQQLQVGDRSAESTSHNTYIIIRHSSLPGYYPPAR